MPGTKLKVFRNNLLILCHPICNWLYRAYKCVVTHIQMSHVTHTDDSCHACDTWERRSAGRVMTHSCVWRDSLMCVTWLIHVCDMTQSCVWRDSLICVTWLILVCVPWLIHMCDMTHSIVRHEVWVIKQSCMNESCRTYEWVTVHIREWLIHTKCE